MGLVPNAKPGVALTGRVLVVDDDEQVRRVLGAMLRRWGFDVDTAGCGDEAISIAHARPLDLAIVDRTMPGMDGIALLQELRELQPACARVLLTGNLDLDATVGAVNRGEIARVLEKPCSSSTLYEAVEQTLAARTRTATAYQHLARARDSVQRQQFEELLRSDHLQLALQPIVRASDGRVVACEALLRSSDPQLRGPGDVLEAAEALEMVPDLASVVINRAARWLTELPADVSLFLNLHPLELADAEALAKRLEPLTREAHRVVLEITERSSLYGIDGWQRSVDIVTKLGFSLAVDDLGAGYSSLSMLAELQPHYIKVDMSITRDVDMFPRKQRLFDLLCRFAEATGATIVAEGIETSAEAEAVTGCGAHLVQGYLFGKPTLTMPQALTAASPPKRTPADVE